MLPHLWDSPGKNTGVGCHFLLQCMKVKSESEVTQSCPTLRDPMDCSLPGSSIHGICQARVLEWGPIAFSEAPPCTRFKSCSLASLNRVLFPLPLISFNCLKKKKTNQKTKNQKNLIKQTHTHMHLAVYTFTTFLYPFFSTLPLLKKKCFRHQITMLIFFKLQFSSVQWLSCV